MKNFVWLLIVCCGLQVAGCRFGEDGSVKEEKERMTQEIAEPYPDKQFTQFFARDCCGMTGADGIYSVLLPDGKTAWIFGDTFLGTVNEDLSREKRHPIFVRNAIAVQDGDNLTTYYGKANGREASLVIPEGAPVGGPFSEDSLWYWPGDGFIENGKLKVFLSRFYQASEGNWGFKWDGTALATFSIPYIKLEEVEVFDLGPGPEVHWGHAICDEDPDHTYIYGLAVDKKPYVARAPKNDISGQWEFFSGSGWSPNPADIVPMIEFNGAEQFSIFKYGDKYVFVSQTGGFSSKVHSMISDNPYWGWKNETYLFTAIPPVADSNLFVYNALAHPQFIKNDELLVSYCVNSFELEDLFKDARKYRPMFYRVPMAMILGE
jgi:hypothetical protein